MGMIAFRWNLCEQAFIDLFGEIAGLPDTLTWVMTKDLGDVSLASRMCEVIQHHPQRFSAKEGDEVRFACKCYDIARQNRNFFQHAVAVGMDKSGDAILAKSSKANRDLIALPSALADMRAVADALLDLLAYIGGLRLYFYGLDGAHPEPLPNRPTPPVLLATSPQRGQPKPPPRRRS